MYYSINRWREKHSLQYLLSTKRGGLIFKGGTIFRRLRTCALFHSLKGNRIEDIGASSLADTLRVNQSLKVIK